MAVTAHMFPEAQQALASKSFNLSSDALFVLLVATGTFTFGATPYGYTKVSQFMAGDGTDGALVEVSTAGTAYARQALTSVTLATAGLVTTLGCANPTWTAATISAKYALFFDAGSGGTGVTANDASTNLLLCYWDFGGVQASSAGTFAVQVNSSGLCTFTAS
jgi:hypothetical protein